MNTIQHWIGGSTTTGASTRTAPVFDPATGQQQSEVLLAETADVDAAVAAARKAFESWRDVSLTRRVRIMFAFRHLVEQHTDEMAKMIAAEHGKTVADAKGEVIRGMEVAEYACGLPQLLKGEYSDQVSTDVDALSFRQPLGVAAGITPFNFPIMVPMWMHPMAIATGNTFILKPSERDPSVSNFVAQLYADAGLPDGVFNVVHGDKTAVDAHPRAPWHQRRVVRRLDADREVRLRARHGGGQARAGPRWGEEPRDRHAGREPRLRGATTSWQPASAPPGSAAWPSPWPSPSGRPATPSWRRSRRGRRA